MLRADAASAGRVRQAVCPSALAPAPISERLSIFKGCVLDPLFNHQAASVFSRVKGASARKIDSSHNDAALNVVRNWFSIHRERGVQGGLRGRRRRSDGLVLPGFIQGEQRCGQSVEPAMKLFASLNLNLHHCSTYFHLIAI